MSKFVLTSFLMLSFAVGALFVNTVHAVTQVSGTIGSNTVWANTNSPYNLTAPIHIVDGVTLTLEAGVTVNLNGYYIQVDGTLYARGSDVNQIFINGNGTIGLQSNTIFFSEPSSDWNEQNLSGCIVEKAIINSALVWINSASPKIHNDTFLGSIILINTESLGAPIVSNNSVMATPATAFLTYGIGCNGNATILGNTVSGWLQSGIYVFYGSPKVEGNLAYNNTVGISVSSLTNDMSIPFPLIKNNGIVNNSIGIYIIGSPAPRINNNNIQYNSNYNIYVHSLGSELFPIQDINATYNWWGTTDTSMINQTIVDYKNNSDLSKVSFTPFLTQPNLDAPPYSPPVMIPEFSLVSLTILIAVTLPLAIFRRRH